MSSSTVEAACRGCADDPRTCPVHRCRHGHERVLCSPRLHSTCRNCGLPIMAVSSWADGGGAVWQHGARNGSGVSCPTTRAEPVEVFDA